MKTRSPVSNGLSPKNRLLKAAEIRLNDSLCNEQKHDRVENIASRILKNETGCNTDSIDTRKSIPNLHPKHAQTDKEQNHKRKEQQDMIKCLKRSANITHTPREETTFFVCLY